VTGSDLSAVEVANPDHGSLVVGHREGKPPAGSDTAVCRSSPRSTVVPRSSLQVSWVERRERRNGATGALSGERCSLRRVGVFLVFGSRMLAGSPVENAPIQSKPRGLPTIATGSPRSALIVSRGASEPGRGTLWDTARGVLRAGELFKGLEGGSTFLLCTGGRALARLECRQSDELGVNVMAQLTSRFGGASSSALASAGAITCSTNPASKAS
jgi:hypothetical protein